MQKFTFWWIILSVLVFFAGMFLSATTTFTGNQTIGTVLWVSGLISIFLFLFYSVFQWFKFKKGEGINNLITAYVLLAFLFVIGGLVGSFLTFPYGMTYFIIGLGMLAAYYVIKLIRVLTMKEEDFQ